MTQENNPFNQKRSFVRAIEEIAIEKFKAMTINLDEDLKGLSPEERAEREKDWVELVEAEIDMLDRLNPELTVQVASKMKPETLLAGLTPEKIAALTPEQRRKILELLGQPEQENQKS